MSVSTITLQDRKLLSEAFGWAADYYRSGSQLLKECGESSEVGYENPVFTAAIRDLRTAHELYEWIAKRAASRHERYDSNRAQASAQSIRELLASTRASKRRGQMRELVKT